MKTKHFIGAIFGTYAIGFLFFAKEIKQEWVNLPAFSAPAAQDSTAQPAGRFINNFTDSLAPVPANNDGTRPASVQHYVFTWQH